jgi:hypothetical protein
MVAIVGSDRAHRRQLLLKIRPAWRELRLAIARIAITATIALTVNQRRIAVVRRAEHKARLIIVAAAPAAAAVVAAAAAVAATPSVAAPSSAASEAAPAAAVAPAVAAPAAAAVSAPAAMAAAVLGEGYGGQG